MYRPVEDCEIVPALDLDVKVGDHHVVGGGDVEAVVAVIARVPTAPRPEGAEGVRHLTWTPQHLCPCKWYEPCHAYTSEISGHGVRHTQTARRGICVGPAGPGVQVLASGAPPAHLMSVTLLMVQNADW